MKSRIRNRAHSTRAHGGAWHLGAWVLVWWLAPTISCGQLPELENPFDFLPPAGQVAEVQTLDAQTLDVQASELPVGAEESTEPDTGAEEAPAANGNENALNVDAAAEEDAEEDVEDALLQRRYNKAVLIDLEGPIFKRFHWYLNLRLDWAQEQGADLVILRLTSPGGYLEESLQLARRLQAIEWATTMVFIPEEAISGAAIISLGADRIYMKTGGLIGDAGPIELGPGGQFEHVEEKLVSYFAIAVAELATGKDRPAALGQAMVDRSLVVVEAIDRKTGRRHYLTQQQAQEVEFQQRFVIGKPVPETGQNRFLTLSAQRAQELQLCEGVFASEQELLGKLDIATLLPTRMTWVDKTVYLLNHPIVTGLLLIVGLIGLYLELAAPGLSVAGMISLFSFGIFFWSHALGGNSGWLEVLLFALGIVCLVCELFVLPGFGVFGLAGIGLVVLSLVMASQDFVIPDSTSQWTQLRTNVLIVLGSVCGVTVLFLGQLLLLDSLPGLRRFQLGAPGASEPTIAGSITALTEAASTTLPALNIGDEGHAASDLRPSGKVTIGQRLVDVVTEGDYVDAGSLVEIMRLEGNRVVVRKKE